MTGWRSGEPTLADIEREFPRWRCTQGNSGLYYAEHQTTGERVSGETRALCRRGSAHLIASRSWPATELGAKAHGAFSPGASSGPSPSPPEMSILRIDAPAVSGVTPVAPSVGDQALSAPQGELRPKM